MAVTFSALPVGPGTGTNSANAANAGIGEAQKFVATASGVITTVAFFIRTGNTAVNVRFAIYADSAGSPGTRLGPEVVLAAPVANAWNYIGGVAASVVAGQSYWVAYLSPSGGNQLQYSDNAASGGTVKDCNNTSLTSHPDPATAYGGTGTFTNIVNVGVLGETGGSARRPILSMLLQGGLQRARALLLIRPPAVVVAAAGPTTYDKTGTVTCGTQTSGADVFESTETGAILAGTQSSGVDVAEHSETGIVQAGTQLTGGRIHETPKTGTVQAGTLLTGVDVFAATETGSVLAGTKASGADTFEATETGTVKAGIQVSGADVFEATETGTVTCGPVLKGAAQAGFVSKLGSVLTGTVMSGADAFTASRTGTVAAFAFVNGGDAFTAARTGTITAGTRLSGTSTKVSPGTFLKTGTVTAGASVSGADVFTASETGTVSVGVRLGGPGAVAPAIPRWPMTPGSHWNTTGTATRWDMDPATRWDMDPATRWDMDPATRWNT